MMNVNIPSGNSLGLNNNPLLQMGLGLLETGGFSQTPQTLGQGLAAGFRNMQRQSVINRQLSYADEKLGMERKRLRMLEARDALKAKAQMQAAEEAERRRLMFPGLLEQVPEGQRAGVAALHAVDPGAAVEMAQGLITPQEPTGLMKNVRAYLNASPEERAAMSQFMPKGTTVNVGTGPKFETPAGKAISDFLIAQQMFGPNDPRTQALAEAASAKSQQATTTDVAKLKGREETFKETALSKVQTLNQAYAAFKENPNAETKAAFDAAYSAAGIAVAQARNTTGEPGDVHIRKFDADTPGSVRGWLQGSMGLGDPTQKSIDSLIKEMGGSATVPTGNGLKGKSTDELLRMLTQ